nr:Asp/Glu racemase [Phaeobacter sp.]
MTAKRMEYDLAPAIGSRATLGLVVLQVDETLEHDFKRMFASPEISLYVSRIPSGQDLNPDTIATMKTTLPAAAGLLPQAAQFDVVGYGCTSGTTLIGQDKVAELVRSGVACGAVADPLTAALAAMAQLDVQRVGLVTPYVESVSAPVAQAFANAGLTVCNSVSFAEEEEAKVARIDPASTFAAALAVGQQPEVEAVFLSCTNLRTFDIIAPLEDRLQKPVVSSNQAMGWQMASLAGCHDICMGPGMLWQHGPQ